MAVRTFARSHRSKAPRFADDRIIVIMAIAITAGSSLWQSSSSVRAFKVVCDTHLMKMEQFLLAVVGSSCQTGRSFERSKVVFSMAVVYSWGFECCLLFGLETFSECFWIFSKLRLFAYACWKYYIINTPSPHFNTFQRLLCKKLYGDHAKIGDGFHHYI